MGSFCHNIQDCMVMDLAFVGHSNIHQILELLEVFMAGHTALSEATGSFLPGEEPKVETSGLQT